MVMKEVMLCDTSWTYDEFSLLLSNLNTPSSVLGSDILTLIGSKAFTNAYEGYILFLLFIVFIVFCLFFIRTKFIYFDLLCNLLSLLICNFYN